MTEFADNLACHATNQRCVVPRPIEGMVAERVLVMTYVDGTPVDDGTTLRAARHDLEDLVRSGVRAWLGGAMEHGMFQADGPDCNMFVTPAGETEFLQFGRMAVPSHGNRGVLRTAHADVPGSSASAPGVRSVVDLAATTEPRH